MEALTQKQKHCLETIIKIRKDKGNSPTLRELGKELGMTAWSAKCHIDALVKKGYIHYSSNISRSIQVLKLPE